MFKKKIKKELDRPKNS